MLADGLPGRQRQAPARPGHHARPRLSRTAADHRAHGVRCGGARPREHLPGRGDLKPINHGAGPARGTRPPAPPGTRRGRPRFPSGAERPKSRGLPGPAAARAVGPCPPRRGRRSVAGWREIPGPGARPGASGVIDCRGGLFCGAGRGCGTSSGDGGGVSRNRARRRAWGTAVPARPANSPRRRWPETRGVRCARGPWASRLASSVGSICWSTTPARARGSTPSTTGTCRRDRCSCASCRRCPRRS